MKYKHRDQLVEGLRELADFIEEKGIELPIDTPWMTLDEYLYDSYIFYSIRHPRTARDKLALAARIMGRAEKRFDFNFTLTRKFGEFVKLEFNISREKVCKRIVKRKRHIPAQTIAAYDEDVVEWICTDPILAGVSDD